MSTTARDPQEPKMTFLDRIFLNDPTGEVGDFIANDIINRSRGERWGVFDGDGDLVVECETEDSAYLQAWDNADATNRWGWYHVGLIGDDNEEA